MNSSSVIWNEKYVPLVVNADMGTLWIINWPLWFPQFILRLFGNDNELLTNRLLISLWDPYRVCGGHAICENLQFMITGFDPSRADEVRNSIVNNFKRICSTYELSNLQNIYTNKDLFKYFKTASCHMHIKKTNLSTGNGTDYSLTQPSWLFHTDTFPLCSGLHFRWVQKWLHVINFRYLQTASKYWLKCDV